MDLDAVLVRHPEAALVDELAHTNVPGSGRNEKRWQDVIELLEADIAVVSTVNVQHLESIADAVERITGVHIREHVPDWVVRKADQIELIDSSPEQLRRRLLHGNVYPPDKIQGALTGFFRTENLVALRELALRFLADSTEDELLEYLEQHHPNTVWETAERILVSVTGAPGTDGVVRRAARMAARLKADLHVLNIRTADAQQPSSAKELEQIKYLVEDLGAIWHEAQGEDASRAIVEFAREHQITQILLGSSRRTRFEEIFKGSIVTRVLRFAAQQEIDVHVIARHRNKIEASTKDEH
jgi:two-component system sensor histidine kinase KdpD